MKNWQKVIKILPLLLIYFAGIYISTKTIAQSDEQIIGNNTKQSEYFSLSAKNLFSHTQQSENSLLSLGEYSLQNFKLPYKIFGAISFSNEMLFSAKFKQYKNHLKTLSIRQRKSDFIFPFHIFW